MLSLKQAQNIINEELNRLSLPSDPTNLYEPIRYILSNGGKRIRPALVLMAASIFTEEYHKALSPAIGIEIFHNFTLLHDDLMDASDIRRGNKTVHKKWNPNISILSGDVMSILAYRSVSEVDDKHLKAVLSIFHRTAIEVCEGQMMDLDFELRDHVGIEEYLKMIELKTSVLIAASLQIGAISAGSDYALSKSLYDFGLNLGIAFQLQDDLLDSFGDSITFGKQIGSDIINNKKTFLMISLLELADENDKKQLQYLLSQKDANPENKIKKVLELFDNYKIKELTEKKIDHYFLKTANILSSISISGDNKRMLSEFSNQLMKRSY